MASLQMACSLSHLRGDGNGALVQGIRSDRGVVQAQARSLQCHSGVPRSSTSASTARPTCRAALSITKGQLLRSPQDPTALFKEQVNRTVTAASSGARPTRGRVTMMPIGTPRVPYRTPGEGGWQWVDIWNVLYRERIVFIGQYIDDEFGNQLVATMLYLDSVDSSKPLNLYINSPGGEITPSMAIYDTIESLSCPVSTLALGYAYNSAGFLLAAGTKGYRIAMPMTRIALQSPAGAARGQADDIQNEARELARVRSYVAQELAKKTGQPLEKVTKDISRIKRFSVQEALEYGLIDRIVRPKRIKPDATSRLQKEAGVGLG
eukprot:TRINITY_DN32761_c0_g1_i1.p1 TRINITY_DN32761_c0_g1~~TRINITY_DN32761_c0_g1_i1.p1  ORF type:complete len:321 (+),score=34.39 TRINITY_DN32761_c0_g1_i1:182-1144(+)